MLKNEPSTALGLFPQNHEHSRVSDVLHSLTILKHGSLLSLSMWLDWKSFQGETKLSETRLKRTEGGRGWRRSTEEDGGDRGRRRQRRTEEDRGDRRTESGGDRGEGSVGTQTSTATQNTLEGTNPKFLLASYGNPGDYMGLRPNWLVNPWLLGESHIFFRKFCSHSG